MDIPILDTHHVSLDFSMAQNTFTFWQGERPHNSLRAPHTSAGKCGPFCHPTPNFSFNYFLCYQDKMIACFVEIFEGGKV